MRTHKISATGLGLLTLLMFMGCATRGPELPVNRDSVDPATSVTFKGEPLALLGTGLVVGGALPSIPLVDAMTMKPVDLADAKGSVLLLSIVPSIDTKVCEAQTHYLGEEGDRLPHGIRRITISRDLPFAQKRFAEEARLTDIQYLSDYKAGSFGISTGLLVDELMLLARSVVVVDKAGVIRYIQVSPELTNLPDMERAFHVAIELDQ